MVYREFQELKLSGLGLGMMRLPVLDGDDGRVDEAAAAEMIDYAYHNGINYFDTAWGYHDGNSELVAGRLILISTFSTMCMREISTPIWIRNTGFWSIC